jgi:hypothetical protein
VLNRALLARQHLLRRSTASLPAMLESVGGLQMQYVPSGYIGCWSRLEGVTRAQVTRALERRQVVQATLLRSTIHLVSAADYPVLFTATRDSRRDNGARAAKMRRLDPLDYDAFADRVRGWFADGPLERTELLDRLAAEGVDRGPLGDAEPVARTGARAAAGDLGAASGAPVRAGCWPHHYPLHKLNQSQQILSH